MKKVLFILAATLISFSAMGQTKGMVTNISSQPLDGVTITLTLNNQLIASAFADTGKFELINIPKSTYIFSATLVGYRAVTRQIDFPKDSLKITMQADSKQLGVVTITGSRPVIEHRIDRTIFNVENSIIASGGSAWDALGKAPGVQAQSDGTLSANKKEVELYIDGKPLHISGTDLQAYLQGLPANLISAVEVFTNPPASFDAQGGAVINIKTKKAKTDGLNISLSGGYTQATYGSYTGSAVFNYRKDKLNIYGNYGYTDNERARLQDNFETYVSPGSYSYWNGNLNYVNKNSSNNYKVGADYQLTPNQVIGILFTGYNSLGSSLSNTLTTVNNNYKAIPDSTLHTNTRTNSNGSRYAFNLNYALKLDTNQSFNIDLDYSPYKKSLNQYQTNLTYLPDGSALPSPYRISTPTVQNINIYSGKMDYNYKIGKWSLSSGIKYSSIQSDNIFNFYNTAGPSPVFVPANSDNFQYTENTGATYTSISGSFGKLSLQAGLRGELTHTRGNSVSLDSVNKTTYFKLFPTLFADYKINDNNELQLTYGYRILRPEYARLNPFKYYITPYNYLTGNPALQPAFVQDIELTYVYNKTISYTAFYTAQHDIFSNITVQDNAEKLFYDTQANLGLSLNSGLRFAAPVTLTDWWSMTINAEAEYRQEKSVYLQGSYNFKKVSYDAGTVQSFTIDKQSGIKAEIDMTYDSPDIQGIFRNGHYFDTDLGVKTNVLNGRGTIKLAASDIFYSEKYHVNVNYLDQNNGFIQKNDSRNANLSFTYHFGGNRLCREVNNY